MLSTVLQLKVVRNVIVKILYIITLDAFIGSIDRGFWFWCITCAGSTSMCYAAARFLFALRVEYNVCTYTLVRFFDNV
jgi:hypothetical protein